MAKNDAENWNLSELGTVADYDKLLAEIDSNIATVEKWWGKLSPKMTKEKFAEFMEYDELLDEKFSRLMYLPELMESTNQKDSVARLMKSKATDLALKFNKTSRKIGHWLKGLEVDGKEKLDDENAKRLSVQNLFCIISRNRQKGDRHFNLFSNRKCSKILPLSI